MQGLIHDGFQQCILISSSVCDYGFSVLLFSTQVFLCALWLSDVLWLFVDIASEHDVDCPWEGIYSSPLNYNWKQSETNIFKRLFR